MTGLEALDNAEPSEALKYINGIIVDLEDGLQQCRAFEKDKDMEFYMEDYLNKCNTIKQALIKAQEQEHAIKIIKEHKLLNYVLKNPKCAKMYNLNQEKIEFLKGVLK